MTRHYLARRYRYLIAGETLAIVVFLIFFVRHAPAGPWPAWIARTYGFALLVAILVQGTRWWFHLLRLLRTRRRTVDRATALRFRRLRRLNWYALAAFPAVLLAKALSVDRPWHSSDTWWGIACILGALLEQINYYHYQLMYDSPYDLRQLRRRRRLRRSSIAKALSAHFSE